MGAGFFAPPDRPRYALRNLRAPGCLVPHHAGAADDEATAIDVLIDGGRIAAVERGGTLPPELGPDLDASFVLPGMLDVHTHLDKGHTWPRAPNPTGHHAAAARATTDDRVAHWTAEDVGRRMDFGLATAYAHGVVAIRTHLDAIAPQAGISFPVFRAARDAWAGRIDLQASSIVPLDLFLEAEGRELADIVALSGGYLGCVTRFRNPQLDVHGADFDCAMTNVFALARERGLDLDLHVDENGDPESQSLLRIARLAVQLDFPGSILCGHCCSLAVQDDERIGAALDACVDAGIDVVSLPTVNMYLQGRHGGVTPRWRGVTVLHEMKARGLRVAVAGDNCRDPFYAYGDHDMLDTFTQAVKIVQLDHPFGDWITSATATPAAIMGLTERGRIRPGVPADLLVLRARNYSELLARHQSDRVVLRNGRAIDTTPPDYRTLDDLVHPPVMLSEAP
jgi:cytosine deaminase